GAHCVLSSFPTRRSSDLDDIVARLGVAEAAFWVAPPSPSMKRLSPRAIGGGTGRTLLVVDDPDAVVGRAVAAGAAESSPVAEEQDRKSTRLNSSHSQISY